MIFLKNIEENKKNMFKSKGLLECSLLHQERNYLKPLKMKCVPI